MDELKKKYQETYATWNKIADLYQEKFMELDIYNHSYNEFCNLLNNDSQILEIGCGPGNITKQLLHRNSSFIITATDVAPNMVHLAQKNNPTAICKVLDAKNIQSITKKYDALMCGFVIPYLSALDTEKFIEGCASVLKPEGILYLSFVEGQGENSGFISGSTGDRMYFYYHSIKSLETWLSNSGLSTMYSTELNYEKSNGEVEPHKILIVKKCPS